VDDASLSLDGDHVRSLGSSKRENGWETFQMPPGRIAIVVESPRFEKRTVEIDAVEGKPMTVTVALSPLRK
jgi:hypothetical protein